MITFQYFSLLFINFQLLFTTFHYLRIQNHNHNDWSVYKSQIKNISILLLPIIPISANKILDIIKVKKELRNIDEIDSNKSLIHDKELGNIEILFKKVE